MGKVKVLDHKPQKYEQQQAESIHRAVILDCKNEGYCLAKCDRNLSMGFVILQVEGETYQLKPMNCPFHVEIYKNNFYSYRDLPLRWAELGTVYRYERSGAMQGLFRVRGFTQVCHFCFAIS